MDDDRWKEMEQVNPKYTKFQNDCTVYHLLKEVFAKQGAIGDFSVGFKNDPRNSIEELEIENEARGARGKDELETEEKDAELEIVGSKKEKGKKGKGKRKSEDTSS